ncbi:nuclear transport factor 2 family protein [Massilia sp. TN1-12]|uniref:nuclear transport factor 2 family protein n=1 Tax=Massilia paldalensis TaxID=3377675 RepID=UPI00384FDE99
MKTIIATSALLLASLAHAQEVRTMPTNDQEAAVAQKLIDRHFEIWNDTDAASRLPKYPAVYTSEFFVADYAGKETGYAAVDRKIGELQKKNAGFRFTPEPITWNHGVGRVTWGYGPKDKPNQIRGEDIFTIEHGKLASARVFIDKQ